MRKEAYLFVIVLSIFFLMVSFVFAQETDNSQNNEGSQIGTNEITITKEKAQNALSGDFNIPGNWMPVVRTIFGLKKDIDWNFLVVLIVLLLGIFIIIYKIVGVIPLFNGNVIKILVSTVISLLISISGGLVGFATFLFGLGGTTEVFRKYGLLHVLLIVVLLLIVVGAISKALNIIETKMSQEEARDLGFKTGMWASLSKFMSKLKGLGVD